MLSRVSERFSVSLVLFLVNISPNRHLKETVLGLLHCAFRIICHGIVLHQGPRPFFVLHSRKGSRRSWVRVILDADFLPKGHHKGYSSWISNVRGSSSACAWHHTVQQITPKRQESIPPSLAKPSVVHQTRCGNRLRRDQGFASNSLGQIQDATSHGIPNTATTLIVRIKVELVSRRVGTTVTPPFGSRTVHDLWKCGGNVALDNMNNAHEHVRRILRKRHKVTKVGRRRSTAAAVAVVVTGPKGRLGG